MTDRNAIIEECVRVVKRYAQCPWPCTQHECDRVCQHAKFVTDQVSALKTTAAPQEAKGNGSAGADGTKTPAAAATSAVHDLLAVIHRDGGHYTAAVGLHWSAVDALKEVQRLRNLLAKHNLLDK